MENIRVKDGFYLERGKYMKILKNIKYREYDIKIYGKFNYDSWSGEDYIEITVDIYHNNLLIKKDTEIAYALEKKRFLFWITQKAKTLKESTEILIVDQENWAKRYVDDLIYRKEMTDGLMDSLGNLK